MRVASTALGVTTLFIVLGLTAILAPTARREWSPVVDATEPRPGRDADSTAVTIDQTPTKSARVDVPLARAVDEARRFARVAGSVVSDTGAPVEGAAVIWIEEAWQCETAADGRFVIDQFSAASLMQGHLVAVHAEHGRSAPTAIADSDEVRLVLDRNAKPQLRGRVEFASGAPVVGCQVDVSRCSETEPSLDSPARFGAESGTTTTDRHGEFCFAGLIDDPAGHSIRVAPELDELRADNVRLGGEPVVLRASDRVLITCRVLDENGSSLPDARLSVAAFAKSFADRVARDPRDRGLALLHEPDRTPIATLHRDGAHFSFWAVPSSIVTLHARASAAEDRHEDAVEAMWIHTQPDRIDRTIRVPMIDAQQGVSVSLKLPVPAIPPVLRCSVTSDDAIHGGRESCRAMTLTRSVGSDVFVSDLLALRVGTHRLRLDFAEQADVPTLAPLESEVIVAEREITALELRASLGARIEVAVEQATRFAPADAESPNVRMRMLLWVECQHPPMRIRGGFDVIRPDDSRGFHAVYATDVIAPLDRAVRVRVMSLRGDAVSLDLDRARTDASRRLRLLLTLGSSGEPTALRTD